MKWIIYIVLPAFLVSCDLFQTRPAEDPNQTRSNYVPASEPKLLIQNLINSFSDKNVDNYRKSFETGFTDKLFSFVPSSAAQVAYQSIWSSWDINSEVQYFNSLQNSVPEELPMTLTLSLDETSFSVLGVDSVKYSSNYSISVPRRDLNALNFQGIVEFTMVRDSRQIWIIYFWKDNAIGDNPSWSDLKGTYAN